ncbi:MAG: beta-ketoacyl-[acyl-carrier-protein] synthase II [Actinobacteria bacterium]|nr:MAG: beta-ketoacyl-[acyl-carrier-protein] synthase II [Actinomycetota bacterium]
MKPTNNRVVITGLAPVCSVGIGKDKFWNAIISGQNGIKKITSFDVLSYTSQIAAEITDFDATKYLDLKLSKRLDRFAQFALVAAKLALEDAKLEVTNENAYDIGVMVGSGIGGLLTLENQHINLLNKGPSRISPFLIPMMISNMAAGQISIMTGAKGYNNCVVTACATGTHAIGDSLELIKRGEAKVIIAGGTEAAITPLGLGGFASMKALSTRNDNPEKASRPFDADRDGFVMGEGAGILILEELEHALQRKAPIYAELIGYGATADAYHMTSPDPQGEGAARAIKQALDTASIAPDKVDYINAHGTSTKYNDEFETLAIKQVFNDYAYKLAVSSTKSMTGHLLGAAGGIEAIASCLAITHDICPPTTNYENPDPSCDLNYVPNKSIQRQVTVALSNSFGFGGHNAVIALKKFTNE